MCPSIISSKEPPRSKEPHRLRRTPTSWGALVVCPRSIQAEVFRPPAQETKGALVPPPWYISSFSTVSCNSCVCVWLCDHWSLHLQH
ncbi:unnamed protein product [Gadus morhua 'NCC']